MSEKTTSNKKIDRMASNKKVNSLSRLLAPLLLANVSLIFILIGFTLNLRESEIPSAENSSSKIVQTDRSNSLLGNKVIAWFFAGAFGYAAIYAIGKNIADK